MMTTSQARALQDAHGQDARDLCNTPKTMLQALRHEMLAAEGVVTIYGGPVTRDELVNDILSRRYPVDKLNEAAHVLYHEPGQVWSACEHCTTGPEPAPPAGQATLFDTPGQLELPL